MSYALDALVLAAIVALPTCFLLWNKADYWHERRKKELLVIEHMELDLEERRERKERRKQA